MSAHVCIEGLRWHVLAIAVLAALIVTPQLVLYRAAAGGWFVNPYAAAGGSFAFLSSPRIGGVLFSIKKGLFFWSPVLLFALPGFASSLAWAGRWRAAAIGTLAIHTYLIASWHDWQFGGSYGHRGFTDVLGLFAPFLAATFSWAGARGRSTRTAIGILAGLAVMLSVLQMTQYWLGLLPIADTTFEQYKAMWGHILR